MTERVGQRLGNYDLLRVLGQGSFADVYLGEHIYLKSFAAIKILHTRLTGDLQENFLNEARILAQLSHPHIVRILDFGIEDGVPFLIMEYASHGTLRQRHPHNSILPLPTVVEYVKQIVDGLQYAHEKKLIHRDLKPDNILIGQRDELLISDFGVALIARTTHASISLDEGFAGTAIYMAPEQLRGHPQFASDQYTLGIMTYEWLCGVRPFQGTIMELFTQHQYVPPTSLRQYMPQLPPAVEQVVLIALEKDPIRRFISVKAFALALERAAYPLQATGTAHPDLPPEASSTLVPEVPQSQIVTPSSSTSSHSDALTLLRDQSSNFITENSRLRQPRTPRNAVLLVGLVLLLILGTLFAATFYNANSGNGEKASKISSVSTSTHNSTGSSIQPSRNSPVPTNSGTSSVGGTINNTPTTTSTGASITPTATKSPAPTPASSLYAVDGKNPTAYKVGGRACAATLSNSTPKAVSFGGVTGTLYFQFSITCHAAWAKIVFDNPVAANALGNAKIVRAGDGLAYTCDEGGNKAVAPGQTSCYTGMVYDGHSETASAYGWYSSTSGSSSWSGRLGPF